MTTCTKCGGGGLIGGNPDKPHELVGAVKTCDRCKGTGVEPGTEAAQAPAQPETAAAPAPDVVPSDAPAQPEHKGILKTIFG